MGNLEEIIKEEWAGIVQDRALLEVLDYEPLAIQSELEARVQGRLNAGDKPVRSASMTPEDRAARIEAAIKREANLCAELKRRRFGVPAGLMVGHGTRLKCQLHRRGLDLFKEDGE